MIKDSNKTVSAATTEGWEEDKQEWLDTFDEEYGTDIDTKAVGIVSRSLYHERMAPSGADASYITTKLVSLLTQARKEGYNAGLGSHDDTICEGIKMGQEALLEEIRKVFKRIK